MSPLLRCTCVPLRYVSLHGPPPTEIYTLSLHDALPISARLLEALASAGCEIGVCASRAGIEVLATERSEEHTSELQSHSDLVCRLLLEKKNSKRTSASIPALVIIRLTFGRALVTARTGA